MPKSIIIKGARQHNLKNIDLEIPRDKMVVITGLSGSGKSSLAIDTIYAEGQRRYLESLNTYARQFLGKMDKPDLDYIEGLSPSIAIEQKSISNNPRSTVGTVTEIYDYLRLLFANVGIPHCPNCGREIVPLTSQELTHKLMSILEENTKFRVLSPIIQRKKGEYSAVFSKLRADGFSRVIVDGIEYSLDEEIELDKNKFHDIDVVIDRLVMRSDDEFRVRLHDAIEQAGRLSEGLVKIWVVGRKPKVYSQELYCPVCNISLPKIRPQLFSFNTPIGSCPSCNGLGTRLFFSENRLFPNKEYNIYDSNLAEIPGFKSYDSYTWRIIEQAALQLDINLEDPIEEIPEDAWHKLLYGTGDELLEFEFSSENNPAATREFYYKTMRTFEGIITTLQRRYMEAKSEDARQQYERWMEERVCDVCKGAKLRKEALAVTILGKNIAEVSAMTVEEALDFLERVEASLNEREKIIVKDVMKELNSRYGFLKNVGLEYLTMNRLARTLSGGESERVRLATQIGSNLVGVLYVLDEPTIGLHARDKFKLINMLKALRDKGNSIIIVEHDEDIIRNADFLVDIGPGAGENGGQIVVADWIDKALLSPESLTARYLRGELHIPIPERRRTDIKDWITIYGARQNNLKNIDVKIPLGVFTVVTGVSGAGKSSLIMDCLYKGLHNLVYRNTYEAPGDFDRIEGYEKIKKIIHVDQSPIGKTPRSIPATYIKIFDYIRELFAQTRDAKIRGYDKGRFSFNKSKRSGGGRCEKCGGVGYLFIEMQFLPDVMVKCDVCKGLRYDSETLEIEFKGKNIADVLDMSFNEAAEFFAEFPAITKQINTVIDVGLGYLKLGQPSTTLSGGEGQRIKLSRELGKRGTSNILYILDEPTTGLHFHDVKKLINVLQRLVNQGNTVIVIEHNMDVIKSADYIIDMGPEGGENGGYVVAQGTPEEIAATEGSYTGYYLRQILEKENGSVAIKKDVNPANANKKGSEIKKGNRKRNAIKNADASGKIAPEKGGKNPRKKNAGKSRAGSRSIKKAEKAAE